MSRYSETILARYSASESEIDEFGRKITVQRLRPWDEATVRKAGDTDIMSVSSMILVASCVRSITDEDGKERLFAPPKNEDDIRLVMTALDQEGMAAALKAYSRLMGIKPNGDQTGEEAVVDAAKNSAETEG